MTWSSTLQINVYSGYFDYIKTSVDNLLLYAINLDVVSLFINLSFLAFNYLELMYFINLNE